MIVKVCGMSDKENILQLVADSSPDLMGLIFYEKSPRYVERHGVDAEFYQNLEIPKVGVFVDAALETILEKIRDYSLSYVQLHGDESVEYILRLKASSPVKIIKVCRVGTEVNWDEVRPFSDVVDMFLFDTQTSKFGGSGVQFDWSIMEQYPFENDFLLSGGVNKKSVGMIHALSAMVPRLSGVDINSRFEFEPGIKDIKRVGKFKKEIKNAVR